MYNFLKPKIEFSLPAYATGLRRKLLKGNSLERLLDLHQDHQEMVGQLTKRLKPKKMTLQEKFAWRFMTEVNILRPDFTNQPKATAGKGIFYNLDDIVKNVRDIWFPEMEDLPQTTWLKQFTVRKLAHYHLQKDEIAISLVFDSLETPREILHYLAFHELLHRDVGVYRKNGRRYSHTGEFKNKEKKYPGYHEMDRKISQYLAR